MIKHLNDMLDSFGYQNYHTKESCLDANSHTHKYVSKCETSENKKLCLRLLFQGK
jgi:hypothetical protein